MSLVTLKNEFNEDLLACRACLATNRKLYSLHQENLLTAYRNLIGHEICPYDTLPQYICSYCNTLLLKYNTFRDHCHRATSYLEEARMRNQNITSEYLRNFQPYVRHAKSETKQLNITDNVIIDENYSNIKIDDNDDHFDETGQYAYSSENIENFKIYTDTVKIKIENGPLNTVNPKKSTKKKKNTTAKKRVVEKTEIVKKRGKFFETKENMSEFEKAFDVEIIVLDHEQQLKDVLERRSSSNYLHSPYKCELCYKGYMGVDILNKHVLSQHDPGVQALVSPPTRKRSAIDYSLTEETDKRYRSHSRGSVVCEYCQFRYKDRRGLNQHLKSHRLKFACKQCSYISRTTFNAKEHYKMHGGHMHECRHCGKSYEKLSSHLSHLRIHHPSEFIWCDVCGEAFIGAFGLNAHKKRAHRHLSLPSTCPTCGAHFVDSAALARHSARDCCSEQSCLHCGEGFTQALELRNHLLDKHRSCTVYSCEKCDKSFTRESLYSAHYRRVHVDAADRTRRKERPWVCEVCGKTLPNKCVLVYHQRNHTGERPYRCAQCPKSFTMRKLLQSHLRVHTSERPYACGSCPKAFKGLSALRTHEHVHSGGQTKSSKNRILQ